MGKENIIYIDSNAKLQEHLPQIQSCARVAVDLEFDRNRYRYGFTLCLMQLMAGEFCYLIDPLAEELDLSGIYAVFQDPSVTTVVFSFQEDMMLLQSLGCRPVNLYDTGVAIRLLDSPQTSLGTVLLDLLGVEVNKDAQKSNWFNRPLTEDQLTYAAQDVLHLFPLMDLIENRIQIADRKEWVRQENLYWQEMDYSLADQIVQLKENDKKDMNQVQWHVYGKLMELREAWAQEYNLPSGRVMRTDYVKEIIVKNGLRYWEKNRSTNNAIRTAEKKALVLEEMKRAEQEALDLGLSKENSARDRWSKEEYQKFKEEKRRKETLLAKVASPIQAEMAARYGENTATYILSNRAAMDVIEGRLTSLPEYRVKLFEEIADFLSIEASPLLENLKAIELKA